MANNMRSNFSATLGPNNTNSLVVAETYAEVIGVLSETHFTQIHK